MVRLGKNGNRGKCRRRRIREEEEEEEVKYVLCADLSTQKDRGTDASLCFFT